MEIGGDADSIPHDGNDGGIASSHRMLSHDRVPGKRGFTNALICSGFIGSTPSWDCFFSGGCPDGDVCVTDSTDASMSACCE